jgi:hypothetical protein
MFNNTVLACAREQAHSKYKPAAPPKLRVQNINLIEGHSLGLIAIMRPPPNGGKHLLSEKLDKSIKTMAMKGPEKSFLL